ncbi:hypothetical protein JCM9140_4289 [Halalkalibacter wakoensis JCM 9140]|uniref:Uncharacterized protein n=1 Tax=Halalkalibacter wakoensis JCM 9140 TaxID=1236970 RepID=W4Q802_9BACI|nr:hypothetical protein JCM9140_4289 [Halalkalibacter wakoensis JCM 9140]
MSKEQSNWIAFLFVSQHRRNNCGTRAVKRIMKAKREQASMSKDIHSGNEGRKRAENKGENLSSLSWKVLNDFSTKVSKRNALSYSNSRAFLL